MNNKTITTKPVKMTTDSSSKGNQPKWYGDGLWFKADHMGYEGLSEIVISKLLAKTNIQNFVIYKPTFIEYEGKKVLFLMNQSVSSRKYQGKIIPPGGIAVREY